MTDGIVVVVRGGAVRCVATAAVADVLARAVTLDEVGLAETPIESAAPVPLPPVVAVTIHLRHPTRVGRLAGRFVRHRLEGSSSTLVLRSRAQVGAGGGTPALVPVAALPVGEVAAGATFDLLVPVGEPGRRRYAGPAATLVVAPSLGALTLARQVVDHRAFLGEGHCAGDAALARMAEEGRATEAEVRAALDVHEAAVVVAMVRDVVRSGS